MKLKTKLFLSFALVALVSVSLGIFVSLLLYSKEIHQDAVADMEMLGRLAKHIYQDELRTAQEQAVLLSNNQALKMMLRYSFPEKNFADLLHKFIQGRIIDAVAIYNQQGEFVAYQSTSTSQIYTFLQQQTLVIQDKPTMQLIKQRDNFYLQVRTPIEDKDTIEGMLLLVYHLSWRENDLLVSKLANLLQVEVSLYLEQYEVNRRGTLPSLEPQQYDTLQQGKSNHILSIEMYTGGYIRHFIPLEDLNGQRIGVIGLGVPANRYVSLTQQAYMVFFALLITCLIVAGLLGSALGHAILVPISILSTGVQKIIREKDLSHRIAVKYNAHDELSLLADAFNRMTVRLHTLVTNLEDMVETRTQEIVHLNERLKQENLRMGAELEIPRTIQRMVLPRGEELARLSAFDIACITEAAEQVGGDYYDILYHEQDGGQIKIGIGDVTGHGLESGLLMLMVQVAVRALFINANTYPEKFLDTLNQTIFHNVTRMGMDKNLTLALVDIDYHTGKTRITGQHEEILLMKNQQITRIDTFDLGFIVGLSEDITPFITCYETVLTPGDGIVLYTDGITEAFNAQRQQYGVARLCQQIEKHWHLSAEDIKQQILHDLKTFADHFQDDITLVILKRR